MSASRCERRRDFVATMKPLALAVAAALSPWSEALALPTGEQVVAGQVGVSRPTSQSMLMQQGSSKAIVNWQGFSIGGNESVSIQQPAASSVILNRVVGNNASEIYGRLSANGQVFLVNPSGVLFGRTAMVDVGALVASTLSIGNEDFLAGRYRFTGNGKPGMVENQGALAARDGGFIALLGGQVSNSGTISARLGTAGLAAGNKITLDFAGDGLVRITVDEAALAAEVRNSGAVIADGGQAILSARSAEALTQAVVNQTGVVRARTLTERQGKIVLDGGSTGQTLASGHARCVRDWSRVRRAARSRCSATTWASRARRCSMRAATPAAARCWSAATTRGRTRPSATRRRRGSVRTRRSARMH